MKVLISILIGLLVVGCGKDRQSINTNVENKAPAKSSEKKVAPKKETRRNVFIENPLTKEESAKLIETAIRKAAKKLTGELTKADYEKVTELDLGYNQLATLHEGPDAGRLTDVKGLENLTQLEALYLSDNQLTNVKGLENLTQLTHLDLHNNKLTDVRGLEKLTQLRELDLGYNQLTDVKGLENLTQLTILCLWGNQLTDVKGLEKLTQLMDLELSANQLTDVKSLEKFTQLTRLLLGANNLTSVQGLEKLTQLKRLWLHNNPDLTKAQIDELQKVLPKCEIEHNAKQ